MEKTATSVSYCILSCKEISFEMKHSPSGKLHADEVSFTFNCKLKPEKPHLAIVLEASLLIAGESSVKVASESIFEITPFDSAFDVSAEGKIVDHIGILPTLFGLAYSSTRGMMAVRTAGTPLGNYPLPIIDAVDMTKKMLRR